MKTFNVLLYKNNKVEYYNILPYFRKCWKEKYRFKKENVIDKKSLKEWIERASQYQFWSRCQYEFLIAPWPLGSYEMNKKVRQLIINKDFDLGDYHDNINFYNAIMCDMYKIDIHEQIMMNIDIITDILWEEFYVTKV